MFSKFLSRFVLFLILILSLRLEADHPKDIFVVWPYTLRGNNGEVLLKFKLSVPKQIILKVKTGNKQSLEEKETPLSLNPNKVYSFKLGKQKCDNFIEYSLIDSHYELSHNIRLLYDFTKIFIKHKYYNREITEKEAITLLSEYGFLDLDTSTRILEEILYGHTENNLEYYASYLYIENLFNEKCIDKALMKDYSFIKIFFKYGFLPVYNYKSILN